MKRERWSSRTLFLFAAVASAAGLGNAWRFPYVTAKYGGGAFLVAYIIVLILFGKPILDIELALGQRMQKAAIGSFQEINAKLGGIGFAAILCGFIVVSYYVVVMAWCGLYTIYSFTLKWGTDTKGFFFNQVLHISKTPFNVGSINLVILVALILGWLCIYFSVRKGVKSVEGVVKITMPLPVILLVALLVRGVTLPGAMDGIIYYLKPDFNSLLNWKVWSEAIGQVFFSLSLAFGIMITYSSYLDIRGDIIENSTIIAISDCLIAVLAGFVVFSTLGYMSLQSGVGISELSTSGPGLAFVVFPKVLSLMPKFSQFFAVLFFVMLLTLAIDSAFSLAEAVIGVVNDRFPNVKKGRIVLGVCTVGFLCGIIFTTQSGLYYLDIVDHFVTNYSLILVGLLETLAVGWIYGADRLRQYINTVSRWEVGVWWDYLVKYIIPLCLVLLLISNFKTDLMVPYEGYPSIFIFLFGWLPVILVFGVILLFFLCGREKIGISNFNGYC